MEEASLSLLKGHEITIKILSDLGIRNFKDLLLFQRFHPSVVQQKKKLSHTGIGEELYERFILAIDIFLEKNKHFSLTDKKPSIFHYMPLILSHSYLKGQDDYPLANQLICSSAISYIGGPKSIGKTIFWLNN
jgi:hypothetical protein